MSISAGIYFYGIEITVENLITLIHEGQVIYHGYSSIHFKQRKTIERLKEKYDITNIHVLLLQDNDIWEKLYYLGQEHKYRFEFLPDELNDLLAEYADGIEVYTTMVDLITNENLVDWYRIMSHDTQINEFEVNLTPHSIRENDDDIKLNMPLFGVCTCIPFQYGKIDMHISGIDELKAMLSQILPEEEQFYLFFPNSCNCCT